MSASRLERSPQAFRPVCQDDRSGTITPLPWTVNISPRFDSNSGENIILWNDIKRVFKKPLYICHENTTISFLADENLEFLRPERIPTFPGFVLDVVIDQSRSDASLESLIIHDSPATTTTSSTSTNHQSLTDPEHTSIEASPSISSSDSSLRFQVARAPEDWGEALESNVSLIDPDPTAINVSLTDSDLTASKEFLRDLELTTSKEFLRDLEPTAAIDASPSISPSDNSLIPPVKRAPEDRGEPLKSSLSQAPPPICRAPQSIPNYNDHINDFYNHTQPTPEYGSRVVLPYSSHPERQKNARIRRGLTAYTRRDSTRDYRHFMRRLIRAANEGHVDAYYVIGCLYYKGQLVGQDYLKAFEWFQNAADEGSANAQNNLGLMYKNGYGLPQDYSKALECYQEATNQGHPSAQSNIGVMYTHGFGIDQDHAKAVDWFQMGASQGVPGAQFNLALMYQKGLGVTQDNSKALEWFLKAARKGHARSQISLKNLCNGGDGDLEDTSSIIKRQESA
ncbi:hypothetical protein BGX27_002351, partial [Mortierella sp. AM989]